MQILRSSFAASSLYRDRPESMKGFLSKRWSFWLALFSCIAFLVGNMVGHHGWNAFWKSVWGQEAEIVFTGTTSPLPKVPDPGRWSPISNHQYDFTDVPEELLVSLPSYIPTRGCDSGEHDRSVLSVDYNGDYSSGGMGCGSHPAADLLTPKGTPVVAAMNGIVDRVEERSWGFGNTVVIKHPNVPDPDYPERKTVLYSSYAHLGNILVSKGEIVTKGKQIAVSGQTGLATAPHLHFQIDKEASFHPYWPFTTSEATEKGLSFMEAVNEGLGQEKAMLYTVNPLAYVENYRTADSDVGTMVAGVDIEIEEERSVEVEEKKSVKEKVLSSIRSYFAAKREARRTARLARLNGRPDPRSSLAIRGESEELSLDSSPSADASGSSLEKSVDTLEESTAERVEKDLTPLVINESDESGEIADPLLTAETDIPMPPMSSEVADMTILSDGEYHGGWEEIVFFARSGDGRFVRNVEFEGEIHLGTAFGNAEFSPSVLTEEQFDSRGKAIVRMLPRSSGHRSIVPAISGVFSARGEPLVFNPAEKVVDEHIASAEVSLEGGEQ